MPLKDNLKQQLQNFGRIPAVSSVMHRPSIKRVLQKNPVGRAFFDNGWGRVHPFDQAHGTDTSGYVSLEELFKNTAVTPGANPYAGSQPSILQQVLATLPGLESSTFIDLGCGKGRPLFVASEFPFRHIVGVELSPELAVIARRNAEIIAASYPSRPKVEVEVGDASKYQFPDGNVVLYLYHPFTDEIFTQLISTLEAALDAQSRIFYVICYNPVAGAKFDASPAFKRRLARTFPYSDEEMGYGPDTCDAVVVWQSALAPAPSEPVDVDAKIVITIPGFRAELEGA